MLHLLEEIDCDWLIASGSLEHGMPEDIYARMARATHRRGQRVVLDCASPGHGAALDGAFQMIKPSLGELRALVGHDLPDNRSPEEAAAALVRQGTARPVAVWLGEHGAFIASGEGLVRVAALPCKVLSAVGARDSVVAAMSLALARGASAPAGRGIAIRTALCGAVEATISRSPNFAPPRLGVRQRSSGAIGEPAGWLCRTR